VAFPGASIAKFPDEFVCVAAGDPFTCTVTLANAVSPVATLPVTVFCAKIAPLQKNNVMKNRNRSFPEWSQMEHPEEEFISRFGKQCFIAI
jgi:hypothetical protein